MCKYSPRGSGANLGVQGAWMISSSSLRSFGALATAALVTFLALSVWAVRDSAPDGDPFASPLGSMVVRPRLAGFAALTALTERVRKAKGLTQRLPLDYGANPRAADQALDGDLLRDLPGAVEVVLASTAAASGESQASAEVDETTWPTANTIVHLLTLQLQRQWSRKDDGDAETVRRAVRFVRFLLGQARSFRELAWAESSCADLLRALSSGLEAGPLTPSRMQALPPMEDLADPAVLARSALEATRNEYTLFAASLDRVRAQKGRLLSRVFFQPNRTRREWLTTMTASAEALQGGEVATAYDALASRATTLSAHQPLVRNSLGARLMAMSVEGTLQALAQSVDLIADLRLLKVRSMMGLYREAHGAWPPDLARLSGPQGAVTFVDPWAKGSLFRYSPTEGRLYSIGRDGRDDHGLFSRGLFYGTGASDLGLGFSK